MASNKNEERETLMNLRSRHIIAFKNYFIDLVCNALNVIGDDVGAEVPTNYIIKTGVTSGRIGFYNGLWLPVSDEGTQNVYGEFTSHRVNGANGFSYAGEDVKVINFTPSHNGITNWLDLVCERLADIEISIRCNLEASRDTVLLLVDSDNNKQTLQNAWLDRKLGLPAIAITKGYENSFDSIQLNNSYISDKLVELKTSVMREALTRLGIVTGNQDKKERVESFEMPVNEAIDSIYIFIDTFNAECKKNGVNATMELNGAIEELHNAENIEVKEVTPNE